MVVEKIPQIAALSLDHKRILIDELWDEIEADECAKPDAEIVQILEERWAQYENDPSSAVTLEEFRKRIGVS